MIKVDDDFIVKADGLDYSAYVIMDGVNPKTKAKVRSERHIGYYPSILKALEAIRNYKIHNSISTSIQSLDGAISLIRESDREFIEKVKEALKDD